MNIATGPLTKAAYKLCLQIEKFPASKEQTKTVTMATELGIDVEKLEAGQTWHKVSEWLPPFGILVILCNIDTQMSFDPFGCKKDIGVLNGDNRTAYWSTFSPDGARVKEAFTHWKLFGDEPQPQAQP